MKKAIIVLICAAFIAGGCVLVYLHFAGSNLSDTTQKAGKYMTPLKAGINDPVQFETLLIEPVNLFVQPKPWNDSSPHIQLELNVTENNKKYSTFLMFYETNGEPKINYPKVFENYTFGLEINNDNVGLAVEKLDFGKDFYIELNQKAVIGKISISFEDSSSELVEDENGGYLESREHFKILASDDNEQTELRFGALHAKGYEKKLLLDSQLGGIEDSQDELLLEWKGYQIFVSDADAKTLKLKVMKK